MFTTISIRDIMKEEVLSNIRKYLKYKSIIQLVLCCAL